MKIVHARMAALAVAGLWMPNPPVIQWMIEGEEITSQVLEEIEVALVDAFGHAGRPLDVTVDDPQAAKKFAVLAAAEAARFWGGYNPSMAVSRASLAYGISKSPDDERGSGLNRQELAKQFVTAICGHQPGGGHKKIIPGHPG